MLHIQSDVLSALENKKCVLLVLLDFSAFVLISMLAGYCDYCRYSQLMDYFRVVCPVLGVWAIMYFIQLLPSIGHFVITIQVMLTDMLHFFMIYALIIIPFMHSFQVIINNHSNEGCTDSFTELFQVAYSLFRIMLNTLDVTKFDIKNREVLYITHVAYTFLVSIMMINFFIALMTNSVNSVSKYRRFAMCTQRSTVSFLMEQRCHQKLKCLYQLFTKNFYVNDGHKVLLVETQSSLS